MSVQFLSTQMTTQTIAQLSNREENITNVGAFTFNYLAITVDTT